jgi:hypothetical protein
VSNNTGVQGPNPILPGVASFAYMYNNGSLRVADGAIVNVDGPDPDVYILGATADFPDPGRLFCGSTSTNSWPPNNYSITGDLCACTQQFEQPPAAQDDQPRTCDGCNGAGWDAERCDCKVSAVGRWGEWGSGCVNGRNPWALCVPGFGHTCHTCVCKGDLCCA